MVGLVMFIDQDSLIHHQLRKYLAQPIILGHLHNVKDESKDAAFLSIHIMYHFSHKCGLQAIPTNTDWARPAIHEPSGWGLLLLCQQEPTGAWLRIRRDWSLYGADGSWHHGPWTSQEPCSTQVCLLTSCMTFLLHLLIKKTRLFVEFFFGE